jgi:hypothetical protein
MSELISAIVPITTDVPVDATDIIRSFENNDERILLFILQIIDEAGSSELRDRLSERFISWDEDHA